MKRQLAISSNSKERAIGLIERLPYWALNAPLTFWKVMASCISITAPRKDWSPGIWSFRLQFEGASRRLRTLINRKKSLPQNNLKMAETLSAYTADVERATAELARVRE